jgi:anti-sigma regulatory factor (Ser/Thr protein kinase)
VFGAWRSLVAHLLWEQGVAGSNPAAPTFRFENRLSRNLSKDMLREGGRCHAPPVITERVAIHPRQRAVTWEYLLAPHPSSIAEARRHVRYALDDHTDSDTIDRVELVVSELVTNAVRHGPGETISLRLVATPGGGVTGEVVDQGAGHAAIGEQDVTDDGLDDGVLAVSGRGLLIVDRLASDWGVEPGSTHVWFRFDR